MPPIAPEIQSPAIKTDKTLTYRQKVARFVRREGLRLEETAMLALLLLSPKGVEVMPAPTTRAPYDLEVVGRRTAYIEVKGSARGDLRWVREAFRRDHPEPFAVLFSLGYPREPVDLIGRAWLFETLERKWRLTEQNWHRLLRRWEVV